MSLLDDVSQLKQHAKHAPETCEALDFTEAEERAYREYLQTLTPEQLAQHYRELDKAFENMMRELGISESPYRPQFDFDVRKK